jgi:nitronate monooxygenase
MRSMQALMDRLGIDLPVILAPMASVASPELVAAVSNAGGLGSYGCARLTPSQVKEEAGRIRALTNRSFNLNFFCHEEPRVTAEQHAAWRARLAPYYAELGIDAGIAATNYGAAFNEEMCDVVVSVRPKVVSFHFGMPPPPLVGRLKAAGCVLMATATTVAEARRLVDLGCDVIIAQGVEAGGHRGMFLTTDLNEQLGTFALVPQVVDAVDVPVVAAGAITDVRGVAAAFALGADAVQVGTAYLFCPEAKVHPLHRAALAEARERGTALTNVFTGRPARSLVNRLVREVGPISPLAPAFPAASEVVQPLSAEGARLDLSDFMPLWAGQAAPLGQEMGAAELTRRLADEGLALLRTLAEQVRQLPHAPSL